MNKKLLTVLSVALLVSMLPACGKKNAKKADKKAHKMHKKDGKQMKSKSHKMHKKDMMMDEDEVK